jgi:hypothetical protein
LVLAPWFAPQCRQRGQFPIKSSELAIVIAAEIAGGFNAQGHQVHDMGVDNYNIDMGRGVYGPLENWGMDIADLGDRSLC